MSYQSSKYNINQYIFDTQQRVDAFDTEVENVMLLSPNITQEEAERTAVQKVFAFNQTEQLPEYNYRKWGTVGVIVMVIVGGVFMYFIGWPILQFIFTLLKMPFEIFLHNDLYGNPPGFWDFFFCIFLFLWIIAAITAFFRAIFNK